MQRKYAITKVKATPERKRILKLEKVASNMKRASEPHFNSETFNKIVPLVAWAEIHNCLNLEFVCTELILTNFLLIM